MTTRFYSKPYFVAEHELAARVKRFLKQGVDAIPAITTGLSDDQPRAVENACSKSLSLLYGSPGTGKTTTLRRIIESYDAHGLKGIILCPTAKAAKRADEVLSTGNTTYQCRPLTTTCHRGLGYSPQQQGFTKNHHNPLIYDYVVGDEWPMAGLLLSNALFSAIDPKKTRIVLCGDPHQLPSIDPGNVFHDLIQSNVVPMVELRKIFRQGANSGIAHNAKRVLEGDMPIRIDPVTQEAFSDWFFMPSDSPSKTQAKIVEYVAERIPARFNVSPISDIQTLSPGKKGEIGTEALNEKLRDALNPPKGKQLSSGFRGFRVGDRVINRRNDYTLQIVNGDVGIVKEIGKEGCTVNFGPGTGADGTGLVTLEKSAGDHTYLAFCYTVHSSQGSEYPISIMPLHKTHWQLLFRNMYYTGMTRPKILQLTVGDPLALERCVNHSVTDRRMTGLQELLAV